MSSETPPWISQTNLICSSHSSLHLMMKRKQVWKAGTAYLKPTPWWTWYWSLCSQNSTAQAFCSLQFCLTRGRAWDQSNRATGGLAAASLSSRGRAPECPPINIRPVPSLSWSWGCRAWSWHPAIEMQGFMEQGSWHNGSEGRTFTDLFPEL